MFEQDVTQLLHQWLLSGTHSALALGIGIVLLSYLLEDLAIVTAATLAVQEYLRVDLALLAIFIGIASGDLALYGLGWLSTRVRALRYHTIRHARSRRLARKLHQHGFTTLFVVRFVPGLRFVGFTLSGVLRLPLTTFLFAVLSATALWTALVFTSFYQLGRMFNWSDSAAVWLILPLGIALMWRVNRLISTRMLKRDYDLN